MAGAGLSLPCAQCGGRGVGRLLEPVCVRVPVKPRRCRGLSGQSLLLSCMRGNALLLLLSQVRNEGVEGGNASVEQPGGTKSYRCHLS